MQASNGIAALELIQRLPQSFRLVITALDLPGITGAAVIETLRIFRPDLSLLCLAASRVLADAEEMKGCLSQPLRSSDLEAALDDGTTDWEPQRLTAVPVAVAAQARARFAMGGDLVEAALELSRGFSRPV